MHESQVTSMFARQGLENGTRLAMAAHRKHDPLVGPLHALVLREFEADGAVVLALLGPILAHLDEQEEVYAAAEQRLHLAAGVLADGLDGLTALAEHDRLLAFPLHIDDLVDLGGAVLALLPFLRLDRDGI